MGAVTSLSQNADTVSYPMQIFIQSEHRYWLVLLVWYSYSAKVLYPYRILVSAEYPAQLYYLHSNRNMSIIIILETKWSIDLLYHVLWFVSITNESYIDSACADTDSAETIRALDSLTTFSCVCLWHTHVLEVSSVRLQWGFGEY